MVASVSTPPPRRPRRPGGRYMARLLRVRVLHVQQLGDDELRDRGHERHADVDDAQSSSSDGRSGGGLRLGRAPPPGPRCRGVRPEHLHGRSTGGWCPARRRRGSRDRRPGRRAPGETPARARQAATKRPLERLGGGEPPRLDAAAWDAARGGRARARHAEQRIHRGLSCATMQPQATLTGRRGDGPSRYVGFSYREVSRRHEDDARKAILCRTEKTSSVERKNL